MTILEVYFINWYMKVAYCGNFAYCCFLLIWVFAITYELVRTLKKLKRLDSLDLDNTNIWKRHYTNNVFKQTLMLIIVLLEMAITGLGQMDAFYIPTNFPLYANKTDLIQHTITDTSILECFAKDSFIGIGVGVFTAEITVYMYIIWTYSLCLNYYSMVFTEKIKWKNLAKPTLSGFVLSTLVITLMFSKYTILIGVFSYTILIVSAVLYLVISHKRLIRTIQAKRFDVNQESKCQVRRIDRELNYVKKIGGFIIIIGVIRVVSVFLCGSIGYIIIPIVRNPCWIESMTDFQKIYSQNLDGITQTIAQVIFTVGKIVNLSYVLLIVSLNMFVACMYYHQKKVQLQKIVKKKYTTYGVTLRRKLIE